MGSVAQLPCAAYRQSQPGVATVESSEQFSPATSEQFSPAANTASAQLLLRWVLEPIPARGVAAVGEAKTNKSH